MKKNIPAALQLFAVRGELSKGLPGVLKSIASIGYKGAEPWGHDGSNLKWRDHDAKEIRRMYDDAGLTCCGFHLATAALQGDNLKRSIEFHQILGNRFLIIAMDKTRMATVAGIDELAGILNDAAETLAGHGMYSGYHAHGFDAQPVNGRPAWDILFEKTRPEVIMQLDVGNYRSGGGDPIATLKRFPNRARSLHLKDFGGSSDSCIGEGTLDLPTIFNLVDEQQNTEWFVIEQCNADGTGFDIARRSLEALKRMGAVK